MVENLIETVHAVGSLIADKSIVVRPEIAGVIARIEVGDGAGVGHRAGLPPGADARLEQRFAGIDIADAGNDALIQQRQLDVERAELEYTQLAQSVQLEVELALRNLETARQQILSQERNVGRAELNYEHAHARLREGVATQLEERDASDQLDQSRLNYLQAVHDYLVARSTYETALGTPLARQADMKLTTN